MNLALVPFPESIVPSIKVDAQLDILSGKLILKYELKGDLSELILPQTKKAQFKDGLYHHTCFEVFLSGTKSKYIEYNFSPSQEWAAFTFSDYRKPEKGILLPPPQIETHFSDKALSLKAEISIKPIETFFESPISFYSLTSVVESRGGNLSYWALSHAGKKPDFHDRKSFKPWS